MSEGVADRILIEIDGQIWTAFENVYIQKSMQDLCGTFTFKLVKRGDLIPFSNGAKVRILVGTQTIGFIPILTGYIEEMVPGHDSKSHYIIVSGRDKTCDVFDSTIGGNIVFNAPINLVSLAKKTLSKSVDYTIDTMNYLKPKIETIDDNIVKSKTLLEKLSKKVGTMILVVVIAFALMTSAYYIARSVHDISQHKIEQKIELEKN